MNKAKKIATMGDRLTKVNRKTSRLIDLFGSILFGLFAYSLWCHHLKFWSIAVSSFTIYLLLCATVNFGAMLRKAVDRKLAISSDK